MPGIGEVVGGSVREDDYAVLKEKLHRYWRHYAPLKLLGLKKFCEYIDLFIVYFRLNTAPDAYQWYVYHDVHVVDESTRS